MKRYLCLFLCLFLSAIRFPQSEILAQARVGLNNPAVQSNINMAGFTITGLPSSFFDLVAPSQTGHTGKYLTTNGTTASWAAVAGGVTGTGTANYLTRWTGTTTLGTGLLYDNGTQVAVGTNTGIDSWTRFYVYGGATGANLDVRGTSGATSDQAVIDLQGSDYATNFKSTYLKHSGVGMPGTIMGITAADLGELTFGGNNALIRTTSSVPIIFGIGNTERMRLTASGLSVTNGVTAASFNGNIFTTGTGTLTLGAGKTFTVNNTLTLAGTDGSTLNINGGGTLGSAAYITPGANVATFLTTPSSANLAAAVTGETGTAGGVVFSISPTFTGTMTAPAIDGGIAANDDITIQGTSSATRTTSYVNLQPTAGNVGISITTPIAKLQVNSTVAATPVLILAGNSLDASVDNTNGVMLAMTHNGTGNRQIVFGDSAGVNDSTKNSFRFIVGSSFDVPNIDGINNTGATAKNINLGSASVNVGVGFTPGTVVQADITSKVHVIGDVRATTGFVNGTGSVSWKQGSGSPEGVATAPVGSLYSRTDGSAATSFYVKESGAGNTGWVGK